MNTTISIFSWLSPAGYHIWLTFLICPKVTSCQLSLSSAGSSWLIWEWLSSAHPILVEPCLAEPSQAEPSRGNTRAEQVVKVVKGFKLEQGGAEWRTFTCHELSLC